MSRFNTPSVTNNTTNIAGGTAYKESPELTLVSALLTSFLEDKYYEKGNKRVSTIAQAIKEVDPLFAAKAALFARTEFGMRSVTHVAAAEIADKVTGKSWASRFFDKVIYRPDDMLEILAYYQKHSGKRQTHAMRKGFAKALERFDAYQLAKYRAGDKKLKLVDVVNLTHPHANKSLTDLVKDTLRNKNTFEAKLSAAGSSEDVEEAKKYAWKDLIERDRIGYMALLKNLRNIIKDAPETLDRALELLTDEKRIRKSLVLPFRFLDAATEISKLPGKEAKQTLMTINQALDISAQNLPHFDGETLVAVDSSGSMNGDVMKHASLFAALLVKSNMADVILWDARGEYLTCNPADSTLSITQQIAAAARHKGGGTNMSAVFHTANRAYDRIVILSDMQSWGHSTYVPYSLQYYSGGYRSTTMPKELEAYRKRANANPFLYSWDLAGHGTLQFPESHVATLAGWSEKVFDIMKLCETDKKALVNKIKAIEL